MKQIDLPREQTVTWNVIPWWNGTTRVTAKERREGAGCARELVEECLPKLEVIVLVGVNAQSAQPHLEGLGFKIIRSAHPSGKVRSGYPEQWQAIPLRWAEARDFINPAKAE